MPPPILQSAVSSTIMNGHIPNHVYDTQSHLENAEHFLHSHHLPLPELAARISAKVHRFLQQQPKDEQIRNVQEQTKISLDVIKQSLDRYDFSELSLSYNGGKDCLVLLILYLTALANHPILKSPNPPPLQTVYILSKHPFQAVEDFVCSTQKTYSLAVTRYATGMKAAFEQYLREFPKVKAVFVGTRRTDPHGANLTHFDETDHGWPQFMRIHPVIDWHYQDIWTFIRSLRIPYCPLYDQGYTSLGGTTDTHRNPALRRESISRRGKPTIEFLPAYNLMEDNEERLGRDKDWKPTDGSGKMLHIDHAANEYAVFDDDDDDDEEASSV